MTRIVTVTPITEEEGARLAHRPGAQPWVDDLLASEVRAKIGELRGSEVPDIALTKVGESEWLAYAMDDAPAGESGMFLVTVRNPSQFGAF
jgi:hypothetical protein